MFHVEQTRTRRITGRQWRYRHYQARGGICARRDQAGEELIRPTSYRVVGVMDPFQVVRSPKATSCGPPRMLEPGSELGGRRG